MISSETPARSRCTVWFAVELEEVAGETLGVDPNAAGDFAFEGEAAVGVGVAQQMAGGLLDGSAGDGRVGAVLNRDGEAHWLLRAEGTQGSAAARPAPRLQGALCDRYDGIRLTLTALAQAVEQLSHGLAMSGMRQPAVRSRSAEQEQKRGLPAEDEESPGRTH